MGLLYGDNALKSLQDYKTQQDFNNSVIISLQNVANAVDVVTKTAGSNGASLIEKQNAIDGLKTSLAALQSNFSTLSTSFASLNTDNGQFKSDVDSTISTFNQTVASFSGSLTSLTASNQQNTNDINTLKQTTSSDLLQKVMTGLTTLQDTVSSIVASTYAPQLNSAIADLKQSFAAFQTATNQNVTSNNADLNNKITTNATAIQANAQEIASNAQAANAGISQNTAAIKAEGDRASKAEADINTHLSAVDNSLQAEITRAKQAESDLTNAISQAGQTAANEAQQAVNTSENYSDNNLTKAKAYTDDSVNHASSSLTAAFQAGDQQTLTASNAYADKLHAELLQTANSALNDATTADNIAQNALATATGAKGEVDALTPQVASASVKASQALAVAQGAPQAVFNVTQGRSYSDAMVSMTSSGSSVSITPGNNAFMIGNYNGGTSQIGSYTLSHGYVYVCQVMGQNGMGYYIIDNRNNGVIYSAVFTPPSH